MVSSRYFFSNKKSVLCFLPVFFLIFFVASNLFAAFKVITVPKNPLNPSVPHPAYNGRKTVFKAIARDDTATTPPGVSGTIYYEWDYNGDGVFDTGTLSTTNPYVLEASYTFPNKTKDQLIIAVIRAKRSGQPDWESYASYPVWIYADVPSAPNSGTTMLVNDDQLAVMRDVAIDDALWWLHKKLGSRSGTGGAIQGYVPRIAYPGHPASATGRAPARNAGIMWAFQIQGHLPAYPPGTTDVPVLNSTYYETDPYAETVCRMMNYVLANLTTEAVPAADESSDGHTRISGTTNNIGLRPSQRTLYDVAIVTGALSLTGMHGTTAKVGIGTYVLNRPMEAVVQELVDWVVMAQNDSGNPMGGWYYTPTTSTSSSYMDASTAQWAYIGLEAAETTMSSYGVYINNRCKHRIPVALFNNQYPNSGTNYGCACYRNNHSNPDFQLTGGAIAACAWLRWNEFPHTGEAGANDQPYADQGLSYTKSQCRDVYDRYLNYLSQDVNWSANNSVRTGQWGNNGDWWSSNHQGATYAMYSIQKGLRTLSSVPTLVGTHNWVREYSSYYINNQDLNGDWYGSWHDDMSGSWIGYQYCGTNLVTAFGVLILTPSVFEPKPVSYAEAQPMSPVEGCSGGDAGNVAFDHSSSFTVDSKRSLSAFKYFFNVTTTDYDSLDWDNPDAVVTDINTQVVHKYMNAGTYTAVLRVEDDNPNGAQYSYFVISGITVQPSDNIGPNAVISAVAPTIINGGVVTLKVSGNASLSGDNSTDPNTACGDTLSYAWDYDEDGQYDDAAGTGTKTIDIDTVYSGLSAPYPIDKTVSLKVTDGAGLFNVTSVTLRIYGDSPVAVVDANTPVTCNGAVSINGTQSTSSIPGTYSIVEYEWDFGDGQSTSTSVDNVTHSYDTYGTYTVRLRVRDDDGSSNWSSWDTASVDVSLGKQSPNADAAGPYVIGSGQDLDMLDGTASNDPDTSCGGGIISYQWDIDGDGDYDENISGAEPDVSWAQLTTLINPLTYTDPVSNTPVYTMRLRVTDVYGAISEDDTTLKIYANRPYAVLANVNSVACNDVVSIDASASYHGYPSAGHYIKSYTIDFGDGNSVSDNTLQFGDTIPVVTHSYDHYDDFTVTLTVADENAVQDTDTIVVQVNQGNIAPLADAAGPYITETGADLTLDASGSSDSNQACGDQIIEYAWDINNNGYYNDPVDIVTASQTTVLSWSSMNSLPLGTAQTVMLRVTDTFGATAVDTTTITVYENQPVADFSITPQQAACNQSVTFDASASYHTYPTCDIITYRWDFDYNGTTPQWDVEGSAAQAEIISFAYPQFGTYTVLLQVEDNNASSKTDEKVLTVQVNQGNHLPQSVISGDLQIAQGDNLQINGSSSSDPDIACGDSIVSYQWDIDGDGDYDENITGEILDIVWSSYQSMVSYPADPVTGVPDNTIRLRVTDTFGAVKESTAVLKIYANRPYAVLDSVNPAACNEVVTIDASASYHGYPQDGHYIKSYTIDFGDGTSVSDNTLQFGDTIPVVTHSYDHYGDFTVILTVADENSVQDTDSITVQVNQGNVTPIADAGGSYEINEGENLMLDATGSLDYNIACGDTLTYLWDIDCDGDYDENISGSTPTLSWTTLQSTQQYPADPQTGLPANIITVRVVDSFGASSTAQTQLRIYGDQPIALMDIDPEPAGCGQVITFDASGSSHEDPRRSLVTFEWDFEADGTYDAQGQIVTHSYSSFGTYTVRLRVTDDIGTTNIDELQVHVSEGNVAPTADANGPYIVNQNEGVILTGTASDSNGACESGFTFEWDLNGDGDYSDPEDGSGQNISLTWQDIVDLGWLYPADPVTREPKNLIHLKTTDTLGLSDVTQTYVRIYYNAPYASITANPENSACNEVVTFDARGSYHGRPDRTITSYNWDFDNDGVFDDAFGSVVTTSFDHYGTFQVTVQVEDAEGHTDTASVMVEVNQGNLPPVASVGGPYAIEINDNLTLDASGSSDPNAGCGDSIVLYEWDIDGDGDYDVSGSNPTKTLTWTELTAPGINLVYPANKDTGLPFNPVVLRVTDSLGGTSTQTGILRVYANAPVALFEVNPTVVPIQISGDAVFTLDASASYHLSPNKSIVTYQWDLENDGVADYTESNPIKNLTYHFADSSIEQTLPIKLTVYDNNNPVKTDTIIKIVTFKPPPTPPSADLKVRESVGGPETNAVVYGSNVVLDGSLSTDPDMGDPYYDYISKAQWDINGDGTYDVTRVLVDTNGDSQVDHLDDPIDLVLEVTSAQLTALAMVPGVTYLPVIRITDGLGETDTDTAEFTLYVDAPVAVLTAVPNRAGCNQVVSLDGSGSYNPYPGRNIVKYEWDLDGNGTFELDGGNVAVTTVSFPQYATYEVSLRVTDDNAQTDTASVQIVVDLGNSPPVADTGGPYVFNYEENFTLNGSGTDVDDACNGGIQSYNWDMDGDGQFDDASGASPAFVWADFAALLGGNVTEGASYPVSLRVTDTLGESGTHSSTMVFYRNQVTATITAVPNPAACLAEISLDASGSGNSHPDYSVVRYEWDFDYDGVTFDIDQQGSASQIYHNFDQFGTYRVAVRAVDNNNPERSDIVWVDVVINQGNLAPIANTGGPYILEQGDNLTLDASASFDPDEACGDSIVEYAWDIDNNGFYDDADDIKTASATSVLPWAAMSGWTIGAAQTVKLRLTDSFGIQTIKQTTITVYENQPVAVFTLNPQQAACNQAVNFDASGSYHTYPTRSLVTYRWDFDYDGATPEWDCEGTVAQAQQVSHTYSLYGTYTVFLQVEDNNSPAKTDEMMLTVDVNQGNQSPQAVIAGTAHIGVGDNLVLDGSSSSDQNSVCGDSIVSYQWDIDGDGDYDESITGENINLPWATVQAMMDYPADPVTSLPSNIIHLRVTDTFGASNEAVAVIRIYSNQPFAVLAAVQPLECAEVVEIDGSASYHGYPQAGHYIKSYIIDFGDGASVSDNTLQFGDSIPVVTHSYNQYGNYTVTLTAEDENGVQDTATTPVYVNQGNLAPVANTGGPYILEQGNDLTLDASGSVDPNSACGDSIVEYAWDINNNGSYDDADDIKTGSSTSVLLWSKMSGWPLTASQPVTLRLTDSFGTTTEKSTTITVYENKPVASFTAVPQQAACNQLVNFDASGSYHTYPTKSIVTYRWDFDYNGTTPNWDAEGNAAQYEQVSHTYTQYGSYTVLLQVLDNNNPVKIDETTLTVDVNQGNQNPQAVIGGALQISVGDSLQLDASSSSDPNSACGDSIVSYQWDIDGDGDYDENISGETINLTWASYQAMVFYPADPVSGAPSNTIHLRVTDTLGGQGQATAVLRIYTNEPVAVFTVSPNPAQCAQTVTFNASGSYHNNPTKNIVTYRWDFDYNGVTPSWDMQGNEAGYQQVTHSYGQYGTYTVLLQIEDSNIPAKVDETTVAVDVSHSLNNADPQADTGGPYVISVGDSLSLDGSQSSDPDESCGDSIVSYEWDLNGDGIYDGAVDVTGETNTVAWTTLSALNLNVADPVTQTPTNTIGLRVTDELGATSASTTVLKIFVNEPVAVASASPQQIACGQSVLLNGEASYHRHPAHSIVTYEWDFDLDGTYDETGAEVTHLYTNVGTNTARLRVTDDQGYTDTTTVDVTLSIVNVAPVADHGGPYTTSILNGTPILVTLDASGSYDPNAPCDSVTQYLWDTDGDGLFGTEDTNGANGQATDYVGAVVSYVNDSWQRGVSYVVSLKVIDSFGVASDVAQTLIEVQSSPPPVLSLLSPDGGECLNGTNEEINFTVSDPEGEVVTVTAKVAGVTVGTVVVDTPDDGSWVLRTITLDTTQFADNTNYKVLLESSDPSGGSSTDDSASMFTIDNTPPSVPVVTVPVSQGCYEGSAPAQVASATDNITAVPTIFRQDSSDGCLWTSTFYAEDSCGNQSGTTEVSYYVSDPNLSVTISGVAEGGLYAPGRTVTYGHNSQSNCVSAVSALWSRQGGPQNQPYQSGDPFNEAGTYTVDVTVTNVCGSTVSDDVSFNINSAPVADAGGPYTGNEGVDIAISAAGSYDTEGLSLTYQWDLDNDGHYDDASGRDITYQWTNKGVYIIGLKVTDPFNASFTDTAQVTVENNLPQVEAGVDQQVDEGDTVNFSGSFTDIGDANTAHTYQWDFGDGEMDNSGTLTPVHSYGDNGLYTVTFTVTDDDGAVGTDTLEMQVYNLPPIVDAGPDLIANEGVPVTFNAVYSDPGILDTHTVRIDWGDTTEDMHPVSNGAFDGTHTYLYKGTYTVEVTVTDDDDNEGVDSFDVIIGRIPLELSVLVETDRSAAILFNGISGKDYDIWYYDGDIMEYDNADNWTVMDTVHVDTAGTYNDNGDPGSDGQFGTADDVRQKPSDVEKRFYRVVETGTVAAGEPWATAQIGFYHNVTLVDGRNFVGKMGAGCNTLAEALDCRFLRLSHDVIMMNQGIVCTYWQGLNAKQAFVFDWQDVLQWSDGSFSVDSDIVEDGHGFLVTLKSGMGPKKVPMTGTVVTQSSVTVDLAPGSYTLAAWPYANETELDNCGLLESGFEGGITARTSDLLYFWNPQTQSYDLPVFYFSPTGEWHNYNQSPCTRKLKPGESFLIKLAPGSNCTQWTSQCQYDAPTHDMKP